MAMYKVAVGFDGFPPGEIIVLGDSPMESGFLEKYGQYLVAYGKRADRDSQGEGPAVRAEEGDGAGVLDGRGDPEAGQGEDPDPEV